MTTTKKQRNKRNHSLCAWLRNDTISYPAIGAFGRDSHSTPLLTPHSQSQPVTDSLTTASISTISSQTETVTITILISQMYITGTWYFISGSNRFSTSQIIEKRNRTWTRAFFWVSRPSQTPPNATELWNFKAVALSVARRRSE